MASGVIHDEWTNESRYVPAIDREAFARQFLAAVECSVPFAATMVRPILPPAWPFLIEPNASCDAFPLVDDQRLYPEDSLPDGERLVR